ncbi:MAG: nitroreductase family protein [Lachnospiraceae bacterium]|nr:nitroreductase family protein [Lachnospiraceae bacterium]
MEAIECIKTRRSVRRYTEEVISKQEIEEIIDVARMAPTWKNTQTLRYVIVQDKSIIDKIANDCLLGFEHNAKTMSQCNTLVVLTQINGRCGYEKDGSFTTSKGTGWEMFDAGIAAQTFCLAAHEKGIGSVIMGIFDDAKVAEAINLPEGQTVTALITIGKPKFAPDPTPRKEVSELVSFI